MDKLNNSQDATRFFRGLGLYLDEAVVHQVVNVLSGDSNQSLYSLHAQRKDKPPPICAKGSVYKIKKLYDTGQLRPYLDYLSNSLAQGKVESEKTEKLPTPDKESVGTNAQEKSDICIAPPDNIDIVVLQSWGIPDKKAADILFHWRKLHREGSHQMCQAFHTLEDNLKNQKIPFRRAELYLHAELHARKFNIDDAISDLERSRKYRIWERPENLKAFFKESEELMKPMIEARQKHLKKIENLLKELQDNVFTSLTTKKYDNLLKMEENTLFENLQIHCYDVYDFFWDLKRNLETAQYLELDKITSEIDEKMDNSKRKELLKLQTDTITSIKQLRKAIDYTLKNKSYSNEWCSDCFHGTQNGTDF